MRLAVGKGQSERGAAPGTQGTTAGQAGVFSAERLDTNHQSLHQGDCGPAPGQPSRLVTQGVQLWGACVGASGVGQSLGSPGSERALVPVGACPVTASLLPSRGEAAQDEFIMAIRRNLSAMAVSDFMHGF